jgi:DNA-binding HxlR family transcriptional regulator
MRDPANPTCQTINGLLQRIGEKWSLLVVETLGEGSKRFNQLRREIPSVSQRMLTLTLRNLERDGLVSRTVTPSIPPRVDYELTELGKSLQAPICGLVSWSHAHSGAVHHDHAHYDAERHVADAAEVSI